MTANRTEDSQKARLAGENPRFEPRTDEGRFQSCADVGGFGDDRRSTLSAMLGMAEDVARLRESITGFLTEFPIVTLFGVIGIGYLLGEIRILGFRLGVAGVLFAGLAVGALGPGVALPSIVSTFGLILFIYTIGIQFGPTFVSPFRRQAYPEAVFCVAMLVLGAGLALALEIWSRFSGATLAGLYSGALTNAPALAAAQEVLRDNHRTMPAAALQQQVDQAVIAFGIAYPFGVLGVMLSIQLYRSLFRIKPAATEAGNRIEVRDFVVQNPRVTGQRLGEILRLHQGPRFLCEPDPT